MRVTKVIREYVEREIGAKFQPQLDEIGKDYQADRDILDSRLKELQAEMESRAEEIAESMGFTFRHGWGDAVCIRSNYSENDEKCKEINQRRRELTEKRDKAIENILLNLELGETTKTELRDAIEAVEV